MGKDVPPRPSPTAGENELDPLVEAAVLSGADEVFAALEGISVPEYQRERAFRDHHSTKAKDYYVLPPGQWPRLEFNWDLADSSQRFAFDGVSAADHAARYPEGLQLGYVEVEAFDAKLCHYNRRGAHELWDVGSSSKLGFMLSYLEEGHPITPVAVSVTPQEELFLLGGNHRYTAARFSGLFEMPIYVPAQDRERVEALIVVRWASRSPSATDIHTPDGP